MRRNNFLIGALTALLTYILLSIFVPRPWGGHHWWHHHEYYYDQDRMDNRKGSRLDLNGSAVSQLGGALKQFFLQTAAR